MFWDITNDALDSSESLVKAAYDSWVLDEDLATIRERSSLTNETIIGGESGQTRRRARQLPAGRLWLAQARRRRTSAAGPMMPTTNSCLD